MYFFMQIANNYFKEGFMFVANWIAYLLVIIGALNWGLFAIFNWNLVAAICGASRNGWAIAIYVLIALAALWLIISPIIWHGTFGLWGDMPK